MVIPSEIQHISQHVSFYNNHILSIDNQTKRILPYDARLRAPFPGFSDHGRGLVAAIA